VQSARRYAEPFSFCGATTSNMARSKPYSEDLRWTLVRMCCVAGLSLDEIVAQTGLKKRTVQRVFQTLNKTGMVLPDQQRSHPQTKLGDDEAKVCREYTCVLEYL